MRSSLFFVLPLLVFGCSSTTVVSSSEPTPGVPPGTVDGPAVCGDGARQTAEACDDGNAEDTDGCTKACALTPASIHLQSFAFHSLSTAANGAQGKLDYVMADTVLPKLPHATEELQVSLTSQTETAFELAIDHVAASKAAAEFVSFAGAIPRKVGAFVLAVPAGRAFLHSTQSSGTEYQVTCHTDAGEVVSESVDRRVYHVKLSGGCDHTRTLSGATDTVKETLTTELTIILLPSGKTEAVSKGAAADPSIFGTSCTLGGSLGHTSAIANTKDCAQGWCAFDGRRELPRPDGTGNYNESYCTADCTTAACPDGWECVDSPGDGAHVCLKEVAVCGDSRQQPDEACDDGNKYERDGCSADCKKVRAGAQLVVQKLSIDGTSYDETVFTKLPASDDTGVAEVDAVSDVGLRVRFTVFDRAASTFETEVALPRAVGPVDVSASSPFYVSLKSGIARFTPTDARLEVLEVGADGRSLRVKLSAAMAAGTAQAVPVESTFVVTLP